MRIKHIAFDLMGVIIEEPHIITNVLFPELKSKGYECDYKRIKELYKLYSIGAITKEEFWNKLKIKVSVGENIEKEAFSKLRIDKDFNTTIQELKRRGYEIGILTDMPKEWALFFIDKYDLKEHFNPIIISSDYRMDKSQKEMFKKYCEIIKREPEHCIMIDDRIRVLKNASCVGFRTVWYKKEEQNDEQDNKQEEQEGFKPDIIIIRLREILEVLK